MRVSTYEIILPLVDENGEKVEENMLLVNGLYGAIDVVSFQAAKDLSSGQTEKLSPELSERLLSRGHITEKEEEGELADMRLLARIHKTLFGRSNIGIVIMPTYDCNFRCPYCFEKHRLAKGQDWLNRTMSQEIIEAIFSALKKYREKGYSLGSCTLYGGEPLLEKNIELVREICTRAKEVGMVQSAVTNGYDLESYISLLEEFKFENVQITVDGAYEVNDCRRRHKSGAASYERILKNVELALNHGVTVSLRVNVGQENLHGLKDLIADLKARGFLDKKSDKRGFFSYYCKATTEDDNPEKAIKEKDVFEELVRTGIKMQEAIKLQGQYSLYYDSLKELLRKKQYPEFSPAYCGSEQGMLVIDPFGRIFSCWDSVAKEEDIVGFTDEHSKRFLFNFNKAKWRTRTVDNMEPCQKCPYLFICKGGCASRALIEHGSYFRQDCGEVKEIFNFVASLVCGLKWQKTQETELSKTLAKPLSLLSSEQRKILMTTKSQKEIFEIIKEIGLILPEKK